MLNLGIVREFTYLVSLLIGIERSWILVLPSADGNKESEKEDGPGSQKYNSREGK